MSSISSIKLYNLRCSLVDEEIPEKNLRTLAVTAKTGLEEARKMSLELINLAIGYYTVTSDTIMLSYNWNHRYVPEIFRESCKNIWFKKIDDVNIIDILEFYIDNVYVKADDEIILCHLKLFAIYSDFALINTVGITPNS